MLVIRRLQHAPRLEPALPVTQDDAAGADEPPDDDDFAEFDKAIRARD